MNRLQYYRLLNFIGLFIFTLVILLPPIIYGYVYPNIGDDSAVHLKWMDEMNTKGFSPIGNIYLGFAMVSYPILWLSRLTGVSVDGIFLWFNYLALVGVGIALYFVLSKLVNRLAGWLGLVVVVFCAQSILFQFYYGVVFNMINVGVILPLLILFAVRYLEGRRIYDLVFFLLLIVVYSSFHTSGIYLPAFALCVMTVYVVYSRIKKRSIPPRLILLGVGVTVLSTICLGLFVPDVRAIVSLHYMEKLKTALAVPIMDYLWTIVSIPTVILLLVFIPLVIVQRRHWYGWMESKTKLLVFFLVCAVLVLVVPSFFKLTGDPWRQALDLTTILAMLVAVLAGVFLSVKRNYISVSVMVLLVGFGLFHNLPTWFGYNSAITQADKGAIAYVNTLNHRTYNCSTTIAPWIYGRFVKQEYSERDSGLLIVRNTPMTPRSTEGNLWYEAPSRVYEPDLSYESVKVFKDGEIVVWVYEKDNR